MANFISKSAFKPQALKYFRLIQEQGQDLIITDHADRIITATAMTMGLPLISKDDKILNYPHVRTIWDQQI